MCHFQPTMFTVLQSRVCILLLLGIFGHCIEFAGQYYSNSQWQGVKATISCWTANGQWMFIENGYSYNNSISHEANYERFAPCVMRRGHLKSPCIHMPNGSIALNYVWTAHECKKPLIPFSASSWCKFPPQLRNLLIVGDSMSADHTSLAFLNEIVRSLNGNISEYCLAARGIGNIAGSQSHNICPQISLDSGRSFINITGIL